MANKNDVYDPAVCTKWVAEYLGVHETTIYRWRCSKPHFPAVLELGERSIRWRKSVIEKYLDDCEMRGNK